MPPISFYPNWPWQSWNTLLSFKGSESDKPHSKSWQKKACQKACDCNAMYKPFRPRLLCCCIPLAWFDVYPIESKSGWLLFGVVAKWHCLSACAWAYPKNGNCWRGTWWLISASGVSHGIWYCISHCLSKPFKVRSIGIFSDCLMICSQQQTNTQTNKQTKIDSYVFVSK
jgi:hypothetical protein